MSFFVSYYSLGFEVYIIDFKTNTIGTDKEGPYIMIKEKIEQEDITLINIYAANIGAHKYVKQILMDIKGETDRNTVIVEDFNTPLLQWVDLPDRTSTRRQCGLNDTLDQMELTAPHSSKINIRLKCT